MRAIATMVTFVAVLSPVWADNQPAGARPAKHLLIFKNVGEFPEYLFYVCPGELQPGKSAIRVPESGQVAISEIDPATANQEIFLFAVPKKLLAKADDPPNVEWFGGEFAGVLKSRPLAPEPPVSLFSISIPNELLVTKLEGTSANFSAPQIEVQKSIALGLISSIDRRVWIIGGALFGIVVVFGFRLVLGRIADRRR